MNSADCIVEAENLTHRFATVTALDRVSFAVGRASLFALLGPNGSGKTTLFRILTTLLTPTAGVARVAGADVVADGNRVLQSIGVAFQRPSLDAKLTAWENLRHQGQLYGLSGPELQRRSLELLERLGLADRANDRVEVLSGGTQRRVELAKSLLHRPQVLILDEPSTGLDPAARLSLMAHLAELRDRDGVTSLLTTHIMEEADRCNQVAIMDCGRVVAIDSPVALKASVGADVVSIRSPQAPALAERISQRFGLQAESYNGVVRVERERGHEFVPHLVEAFPGDIDSVSVAKPTLEDVFLRLTRHRFDERLRPQEAP